MRPGQAYIDRLAAEMERVIAESEDPTAAMRMIVAEGEKAGLIVHPPRMSEPWVFVMDVLTENPLALDWAEIRRQTDPLPPGRMALDQVLDRIR